MARIFVVVALFAILSAWPAIAGQQNTATSDTTVKAAFLYNFTKFTEWAPRGPAVPFTLCVVGDPRLASALVDTVRTHTIDGHALAVRAMGGDEPMHSCDVVFVQASETRRAVAGLRSLRILPILTVGDSKDFAKTDGIIEFLIGDGRVRFAVNIDAAERAGIRLSSRLLGLARIVRDPHAQ